MKRIGILYHPLIEAAHTQAEKLQKFLESSNFTVWLCSAWEGHKARAQVDGTDLVLSIGGDGTILRAAQVVFPAQIPIIGVNLGKLGFMTELGADEALEKIPALLAGEGWIDERAMIEVELPPDEHEPTKVFCALNDVVVARGAIARMVHIEATIDGEPLTTYRVDGMIAATATGSTGYSLAAGGPILHPQAREFLLTPIMPHLSSTHSLVLSATAVVTLHISTAHQATLSIDGHINLPLSSGAMIKVKHSSKVTRFLRTPPQTSFYGSLGQRLKGKQ